MTIRKFAPKTQHDYVQRVKNFAAFLGRSPDTSIFEDVRRYQLHLSASGVGVPTINQTLSTLRFLFRVTLKRHEIVEHTPCHSRAAQAAGGAERGGRGAFCDRHGREGQCRAFSAVTVVTCLRAFSTLHARLRAHRAPGIPCALVISEGRTIRVKLARTRGEIAKPYPDAASQSMIYRIQMLTSINPDAISPPPGTSGLLALNWNRDDWIDPIERWAR
jgi:hypothetical protein